MTINQPDAAWVYLDTEKGMYVLDCWLCESRKAFDIDQPFPPFPSVGVIPEYLIFAANRHNKEHHA